MKVISVGANHAGTSFLRTLAKINDNNMEIVAYDKNSNISFLGCGIALWVAGEFEDPQGLFYSNQEQLKGMGIDVKIEHEVVEVNTKEKYVMVKNLQTGETFKDEYDKLVYAAGTWPIVPPFPGVDLEGIYLSKIFQHAQKIKEEALKPEVKNVVVIGAGYIGIELVEAFVKYNKKVTLIDMEDRVVPRYFDHEFTEPLQERMEKDGVALRFKEAVKEFQGDSEGRVKKVVTDAGEYDADMVIMSIGFRPQTQMLKGQVDMLPTGAIIVNNEMKTSNPDVYAIGDTTALQHNVFKNNMSVALATNAVKTGLVAALSVAGKAVKFPGVQGTNGINVFGCFYSSTGVSEESAKRFNIDHKTVFLKDLDRPEFMHNAEDVQIKLVYDPKTLKLLGAQIGSFGVHNHSEVIFALSLAIQKEMTLPEIALMDVYFLPHYNKPFNFILQPILNVLGLNYKE
ncbi:MAG: FAD-dependent oxidoreductase [Mycoplasma sp.]|nr:FAD-dependent oxidoreductase [Mycoplasma sp.]